MAFFTHWNQNKKNCYFHYYTASTVVTVHTLIQHTRTCTTRHNTTVITRLVSLFLNSEQYFLFYSIYNAVRYAALAEYALQCVSVTSECVFQTSTAGSEPSP